jgi:magnesium-transporting ATPase (P-type)
VGGRRAVCLNLNLTLTLNQVREWEAGALHAASLCVVASEREARLAAAYAELESGLQLLGATGIEDRLQEGVRECLSSLRAGGVRVWMLTGDKSSTAKQVALAAGLLQTTPQPEPTPLSLNPKPSTLNPKP